MEQVLVNSMKGAPVNQCWTGKDLAAEFGDNSSLGLVLRRLEEKTWSQGKVICQVRLNGEILSEDQEKTLGDLALTEIKNLSIAIENPDRLISSTLQSQLQMLEPLKNQCLTASEQFRDAQLDEAHQKLNDLLEASRWLTEGLTLIKSIHEGADTDQWQAAEEKYRMALDELVRALEVSDHNQTADILEYEVLTSFEAWSEVLGRLLEMCVSDQG